MTVRRSALFAPADEPELMAKAVDTPADAVIFDLEDAVSAAHLPAARENLATAGRDADTTEIGTRVNGLDTEYWLDDLVAAVEADVDAVLVPKVESPSELAAVADALGALADEPPVVRFAIESPRGLLAGREIAAEAADWPFVTGLSFGLADYCRAIGAPDVSERVRELLSFRVSALAAANDLAAFASTHLDVDDEAGVRSAAELSRSLGFVGMGAIHPDHVPILNDVFTPDPDRVEKARRLVEAYDESDSDSLHVEGEFLDDATVDRYRALIERYEAIQAREAGGGS